MTICMALECTDGAVLCADTQVTIDASLKYPASKFVVATVPGLRLFFALAGNVAFAKMAIDILIEDIRKVGSNTESSWNPLQVLRDSVKAIHKVYSTILGKASKDKVSLSLLIALQQKDKVSLYEVDGPFISTVKSFGAIGCGSVLASQLVQDLLRPGMRLGVVSHVAAYILSQVKSYVDGCGGKSQILLITNHASHDVMSSDEVIQLENGYRSILNALRPLITCTRRTDILTDDDTVFERDLEKFVKVVRQEKSVRGTFLGLLEQKERDQAEAFAEQDMEEGRWPFDDEG